MKEHAIKILKYELEEAKSNLVGIRQNIEMNEAHVDKLYKRQYTLKEQIESYKYAIEVLKQ